MLYQIERQLLKPANHSLEATGDAALIWNQACMIGVVQLPVMGRTPAPQLKAVMWQSK